MVKSEGNNLELRAQKSVCLWRGSVERITRRKRNEREKFEMNKNERRRKSRGRKWEEERKG